MLFLTRLIPLLGFVSAQIVLPQPIGPYGVSLTNIEFVDSSRSDPFTGDPERKVPVSFFAPTGPANQCVSVEQAYMPPGVADHWETFVTQNTGLPANGTFSQVQFSLCEANSSSTESYPLVLFSPGNGYSRQLYDILCSYIAAQGFTVVNIDTPGEAEIVELANGTFVYSTFVLNETTIDLALETRVNDTLFVLDNLSTNHTNLNTSAAALFGHSFGGATSAAAIVEDERIIVGANLDGALFGSGLEKGTDNPFLLFGSSPPGDAMHNQTTMIGWATFWENLSGPKWQLTLVNSTHLTFTDLNLLAYVFGISDLPGVGDAVGSIDPIDSLAIQVGTLSSLAAYAFNYTSVETVLTVATNYTEVIVNNATDVGKQP